MIHGSGQPSLFARFRPYLAHFFPENSRFFARFHRLAETVPTSPKPEPRAKKQCQGRPNTVLPVGLTQTAILAVLSQRLSLLVMGMEVEKFYPKQYGKGVALTDALGGAEGVRMIRKSVAADDRIHLGEAVEQLQMKALEGGVENRIAKAEQVNFAIF